MKQEMVLHVLRFLIIIVKVVVAIFPHKWSMKRLQKALCIAVPGAVFYISLKINFFLLNSTSIPYYIQMS